MISESLQLNAVLLYRVQKVSYLNRIAVVLSQFCLIEVFERSFKTYHLAFLIQSEPWFFLDKLRPRGDLPIAENRQKIHQIFTKSSLLPSESCNFLPAIFILFSSLIFDRVSDGNPLFLLCIGPDKDSLCT